MWTCACDGGFKGSGFKRNCTHARQPALPARPRDCGSPCALGPSFRLRLRLTERKRPPGSPPTHARPVVIGPRIAWRRRLQLRLVQVLVLLSICLPPSLTTRTFVRPKSGCTCIQPMFETVPDIGYAPEDRSTIRPPSHGMIK